MLNHKKRFYQRQDEVRLNSDDLSIFPMLSSETRIRLRNRARIIDLGCAINQKYR